MSPKDLALRVWRSRRLRRILRWSLISAALSSALATAAFLLAAHYAQQDFRPIHAELPPELLAVIDSIEGYRRDEDATYLTFTEWYLVFNPQDYGRSLTEAPPSRFPYFTSIAQIWGGYAQTYGIAEKHYPFNSGYNLMLCVIGASSTVELGIKGVYENTLGRFTEWTASAPTPEDAFAAQVAVEYGAFIPTTPWFEFPYSQKLAQLWTTTDLFGPNFIRKTERKCFLSLEYGVKTIYAALIRAASQSVYGAAAEEVHLTAKNITPAALSLPHIRPVRQLGPDLWIIAVPHYQGFTDTLPILAAAGVDFLEIAGNDEILLTLVAPKTWTNNLPAGKTLFTQPMLSNPQTQRHAIQVPTANLAAVLRSLQAQSLPPEHLYDY